MKRLLGVLLVTVVAMVGCNGMPPVRHELLSAEELPSALAAWEEPVDQVVVRGEVVGQDTYFQVSLGPCPGSVKIKRVEGGSMGYYVTAKLSEETGQSIYSTAYIKVPESQRVPALVSIRIDDWHQHFWAMDRSGGVSPKDPETFLRPAAYQTREPFQCTEPNK